MPKKRLEVDGADRNDMERMFNEAAARLLAASEERLATLAPDLYLLKEWWTRAEAARYCGMGEDWLREQERAGLITPARIGTIGGHGSPRYRKADVDALIASMQKAA